MTHPTRLSIIQNYTRKGGSSPSIPEMCVDRIIVLYHSSLFVGHQGVIKTYLTMRDKFLFLTSYIISGLT